MLEKLKILSHRYPLLQVVALQYVKSIGSDDISKCLFSRIVKKYIKFPILLPYKNIYEFANEPCHSISKRFQSSLVYYEKDGNLDELDQDLNVQDSESVETTSELFVHALKNPDISSALQNLFLSFPGCISVEESGNRFFLSDVNHHRIIVFNSNGKILDAIGSSPGFEDGVFESSKLMCPAASFYHASQDCLYFVDSENHALRRADMGRRVVETILPANPGSRKKGFWKWILDKLWMERIEKSEAEEFNYKFFYLPWHLLNSSDNHLLILNQSFGTLWIIDLESSSIREVVKDSSKIMEICGHIAMEKTSSLRQIPSDWLQLQLNSNVPFEGIPYAGLVSSVATYQDYVIICDTVGQVVVKYNRQSGSLTTFSFSNFKVLGLPYWFLSPPEQVYSVDGVPGIEPNHIQNFNLLPGRVDIELSISIPQQTELVEQPQKGCIWLQARGAAVEISGLENNAASTEKVGIAQQWFDELDNLCYSTPLEELNTEAESRFTGNEMREGVAHIGCSINTSPGTSEIIVYAALYLRLKKNTASLTDSRGNKAATIANILDPHKRFNRDLLVNLLATSPRDLEELVFTKPLHVRLKFDSPVHPKADNLRDIILTESSVKVNVIL